MKTYKFCKGKLGYLERAEYYCYKCQSEF